MDPMLYEVYRQLAAQSAPPRTITPSPGSARPLTFPNDRPLPPVSRPLVTTLPNPGTGHGRGAVDLLNERARTMELLLYALLSAGAAQPPPAMPPPPVPPGGAPPYRPLYTPVRTITKPIPPAPAADLARTGITTLPNPGTGHGRSALERNADVLGARADELAFWRDR